MLFTKNSPKRICADAGYGSLLNYSYLNEKQIVNYVKHQSWEGNMSGKYPDCYYLNDDGTITCLNNKIGFEVQIINRHPKKKGAVFFKVEGCNSCNFMSYCKRFLNCLTDDFKIFECNKKLQFFKQQANTNLLSPKGIELRVNRSIQVEGAFGIQKQDYGRTRFRRRGIENVSTESMLNFIGFNIAKLFRFYNTGKLNSFWKAPDNLMEQKFAKPSWKKLSKKGRKTNQKMRVNYYDKK